VDNVFNVNITEPKAEDKQELTEIAKILSTLSKSEKERVLYTLQGLRMADRVAQGKAAGM
jgi:hypothetical protein